MTATSTFCLPTTTTKYGLSPQIDWPAVWVSSQGLLLSLESQNHRPQTSEVASAVWSLLFSTTARYDMSMLWLDTIPIWICEWDLAGAITVFIAAQCDCMLHWVTQEGLNAPCTSLFIKLHWLLPHWQPLTCSSNNCLIVNSYLIWNEWLPRPQAAAAAIRAILAWVSSLTSVHSSQHCWCNWPLENINHRLQTVEKANPDLSSTLFRFMTSAKTHSMFSSNDFT